MTRREESLGRMIEKTRKLLTETPVQELLGNCPLCGPGISEMPCDGCATPCDGCGMSHYPECMPR